MKTTGACELLAPLFLATLSFPIQAASPTDQQIQAAIDRGVAAGSPKKLWAEIRKRQEYRINRAGMDPIEKKVVLLADLDRIALEAAEAKRQMRTVSVDQIKVGMPLDVIEVLPEANCYNIKYAGSLPKWGPGGVHVVLRIGEDVVQPLDRYAGQSDSAAVLPQEHGLVTRQRAVFAYTPLYRSAPYERASLRTWFIFSPPPAGVQSLTVLAISGDGKQKAKEVGNPQ